MFITASFVKFSDKLKTTTNILVFAELDYFWLSWYSNILKADFNY